MSFWKNLYTGVKVALAVGAVVNGSKVGSKKINIKELPDILDIVDKVELVVKAGKAAQDAKKDTDGGSVQ
jgi:hypothetical protein